MRRVDVIIQQKSGEIASTHNRISLSHRTNSHRDSSKTHYPRVVDCITTPPVCIQVHAKLVWIAVVCFPSQQIRLEPRIPHHHPFMVLMLAGRRLVDTIFDFLFIDGLVALDVEFFLVEIRRWISGPSKPVCAFDIEKRTMDADVVVWCWICGFLWRARILAVVVVAFLVFALVVLVPPHGFKRRV